MPLQRMIVVPCFWYLVASTFPTKSVYAGYRCMFVVCQIQRTVERCYRERHDCLAT